MRAELADALSEKREFARTVGRHRSDGTYVVERRGASSSGHRKVFDSFEALRSLYRSLPERVRASDLDRDGLTGSRRHAVLWHFVEHPAFECDRIARQPLTVVKRGDRVE
nr:hypothetical protein [Halovivax limisalsi]